MIFNYSRPFTRGHMDVCPAKGSKCHNCHGLNHWKKVCRSAPQVSAIEEESDWGDTFVIESLLVEAVESSGSRPYPSANILMTLCKKENICAFKLDTGSQADVISLGTIRRLFRPPYTLKKTSNRLVAYGGSSIDCLGKIDIECMSIASGKSVILSFFVISQEAAPILSH